MNYSNLPVGTILICKKSIDENRPDEINWRIKILDHDTGLENNPIYKVEMLDAFWDGGHHFKVGEIYPSFGIISDDEEFELWTPEPETIDTRDRLSLIDDI